nr:heavy-metal-associated domain (N-terminus) and membrane-bounded cytochrome biogenesis cycZ-like domain, possible membrane copper tolerance protein [uncultured bacterium]
MKALFIGAILMGLVGNMHCLGMCGPIALAVPVKDGNRKNRLASAFIYNSGRVLVYVLFGALFGLFGQGIQMAGFQQNTSIIIGILIILTLLFPILFNKFNILNSPIFLWVTKLKMAFQGQFKKRTYRSIFTIGLLNGLLPCGLVYMALAGSLAAGSVWNGMAFMALFGIGTLPVMVALPYYSSLIKTPVKQKFKKLVPAFILAFGILFILRGSNLNIPFISPQIQTENSEEIKCH